MSYAYDTIADIIRLAEENNISFGDVVLRYELENYDRNEEAVIREIEHRHRDNHNSNDSEKASRKRALHD